MTDEQTIKEEKANVLYWRFNDWLATVRLNGVERDEIEEIIDKFKKLTITNYL